MAKARLGLDGELYRHVGREIRKRREVLGLKQEELGSRVGLSRGSIANMEAGKQAVPLHLLVAISRTLDASLDSILPGRRSGSFQAPAADIPPEVQAFMRELAAS